MHGSGAGATWMRRHRNHLTVECEWRSVDHQCGGVGTETDADAEVASCRSVRISKQTWRAVLTSVSWYVEQYQLHPRHHHPHHVLSMVSNQQHGHHSNWWREENAEDEMAMKSQPWMTCYEWRSFVLQSLLHDSTQHQPHHHRRRHHHLVRWIATQPDVSQPLLFLFLLPPLLALDPVLDLVRSPTPNHD